MIGVGLYWAEGSKSKPYDRRERITFRNSDPTMIGAFMKWLALLGVDSSSCRFRVQIHESADVDRAERFWSELVEVPRDRFSRATLKRHRPQTNRLNVGDGYNGCLVITVLQSAALYRSVAGWWQGIHAQMTQQPVRAAAWEGASPWQAWRVLGRKLDM